MDRQNAIERQLANEIEYEVGPPRHVDALAITRQAKSDSPTWRSMAMPSTFKFAVAAAVLLFVGGLLLSGVVTPPADDAVVPAAVTADASPTATGDSAVADAQAFPTGLFVSTNLDDWFMEFNEDGTARVFIHPDNVEVGFEYVVEGDLFTEALDVDAGEVGETYRWGYDGEILSIEPLGEVSDTHPANRAGIDWRLVPDPVEIIVAGEEIPVGGTVYSTWAVVGIVPGAEAPPDAYLDVKEVMGRIAVVPIEQGQPITPAMLEPLE